MCCVALGAAPTPPYTSGRVLGWSRSLSISSPSSEKVRYMWVCAVCGCWCVGCGHVCGYVWCVWRELCGVCGDVCGISGMCVGCRGLGFGCGVFVTCLKDLVCTDPHWCVCGMLCCGGTPCSGSMQAAVPVASQTAAATPTSVGDVMAALYGGVVCGALGSGNGWQCLDAVGATPSSHAPPPHPRPAPPCPVHSFCCARHSGSTWVGGGGGEEGEL